MAYDKQRFFERVLNEYKQKDAEARSQGLKAPGIPILTQGVFRSEQFIQSTITSYNFGVLQSDITGTTGTVLPTEIRLQTNDNFHIAEIGIFVAVTSASTDTNFVLDTYPNEVTYGATARLGMLNIYNGNLKINVNQTDVLTNWDIQKHYFVPQTQRLSAAAASNRDQVDLSINGFYEAAPSLMLSGAYTNAITISLPGAVSNAVASNNSRIVIFFRGLRAQNAAIRK